MPGEVLGYPPKCVYITSGTKVLIKLKIARLDDNNSKINYNLDYKKIK